MARTYRQNLVDRIKASSPKEILDYMIGHPDEFRNDAALAAVVLAVLAEHDIHTLRARALLRGLTEEKVT